MRTIEGLHCSRRDRVSWYARYGFVPIEGCCSDGATKDVSRRADYGTVNPLVSVKCPLPAWIYSTRFFLHPPSLMAISYRGDYRISATNGRKVHGRNHGLIDAARLTVFTTRAIE